MINKKVAISPKKVKITAKTTVEDAGGSNGVKSVNSKFQKSLEGSNKQSASLMMDTSDESTNMKDQRSSALKNQQEDGMGVKRAHDESNAETDPAGKKPKLEELPIKAKHLWVTLISENCPKEKQLKLCEELYSLIKGNIKELAFADGTAGVVECLVSLGNDEIRNRLYASLRDIMVELMKSKYAKHIVMKMMRHGSWKHRNGIMLAMHGKVAELVCHSEAADVVGLAYDRFANAQQRAYMTEEFYGPTFAFFESNGMKKLSVVFAKQPSLKDGILAYMKETLKAIVDKSVMKQSFIHQILLEYLTHCSPESRSEMIEFICEHVVEALHTKNGARVGMQCIFHGTENDRSVIIKSMKGRVFKICLDEHGFMVLLAILDQVDDTRLVQQVIIEELMTKAVDLAFDKLGRKVLLHLVAPRSKVYFYTQYVNILEQGDNNTTSKKDSSIRHMEYLKAVSANLLKLVADNAAKMIVCNSANMVAEAILIHCKGNPQPAFQKIVECIEERSDETGDTVGPHLIDNTLVHKLLRSVFQSDKLRANEKDAVLFSQLLLDLVPSSVLQLWLNSNRGCFMILFLLETEIPLVIARVKELLKSSMEKIYKLQKDFKGAELLYKALTKPENVFKTTKNAVEVSPKNAKITAKQTGKDAAGNKNATGGVKRAENFFETTKKEVAISPEIAKIPAKQTVKDATGSENATKRVKRAENVFEMTKKEVAISPEIAKIPVKQTVKYAAGGENATKGVKRAENVFEMTKKEVAISPEIAKIPEKQAVKDAAGSKYATEGVEIVKSKFSKSLKGAITPSASLMMDANNKSTKVEDGQSSAFASKRKNKVKSKASRKPPKGWHVCEMSSRR